jgi:FAD/FMN-containing dehydrogenase
MNFKGKIIKRNEEGFNEAVFSRVFNHRRPNRVPLMVAFPENEEDVVAIVRYAKENGYKIAVRAGGHSWAIWSVRDEAILVDMQHFTKIEIDQNTWIAKVQPATRNLELQPILASYGRFFAGGHCPTVAVGGFLLQGGQGWLARSRGWSAEQIVGIDLVTADGELVHANKEQNTDLYWAARGAGPGFFGLITCFHLQTSPNSKYMMASTIIFPNTVTKPLLQWLQEMHGTVAASVELVALGQSIPQLEGVEGTNIPVFLIHALAFVDSEEEGIEALKPFEQCPMMEQAYVRREYYHTNFKEQFDLQLEANPEGHRWAVSNAWLEGTPQKVAETIAPAFMHLPNPKAFTLWYSMAPLRPLPDMAFSMQSDIYMATYVVWKDETEDDHNNRWIKHTMTDIASVTKGQYLGDSDFQVHQRKFVSDENWKKLQEIQKQRDPNNIFVGYLTANNETLNENEF